MNIVQVDKELSGGAWSELDRVYVCVPVDLNESDNVREAAFRFVNKRKEVDYSEMANHTRILAIENMSKDQFDMMFTHVN